MDSILLFKGVKFIIVLTLTIVNNAILEDFLQRKNVLFFHKIVILSMIIVNAKNVDKVILKIRDNVFQKIQIIVQVDIYPINIIVKIISH